MSAQNILLSLGKRLEVWKVPPEEVGDVCVSYQDCGVKDGAVLISEYGTGKTFEQACEDYLKQIHGKTLVFNACSSSREEIRVL